MSFLIHEASERLKESSLVRVSRLIDWEALRYKMGTLGRSGYGPHAYDPVGMLKALILQAWHSLSDRELEEALRVRLDFMIITGLTEIPDETTFCRFRNLLIKQNLMDDLLAAVNIALEHKGLKVKASLGAIVDATLIASAARPRKELECVAVDREEEVFAVSQEILSKDPDATWLKKGKRSYFGYKGFMMTDTEDAFITHVHTTSANLSEVTELAPILDSTEIQGRLYADKGYASLANKKLLQLKRIKNGIMEKARKNKPLTFWQKRFNYLIAKVRYKVEQGFGTLKRIFNFTRASYFTRAKVQAQMTLKAIAFNLLKALNKYQKMLQTPPLCLP
jgi:IS5 family transposase